MTGATVFLELVQGLGIELVCTTAGCPYSNPHILRPAAFPPTDGYLPPEDPLVGVARPNEATRQLKQLFPKLAWSPAVTHWTHFIATDQNAKLSM